LCLDWHGFWTLITAVDHRHIHIPWEASPMKNDTSGGGQGGYGRRMRRGRGNLEVRETTVGRGYEAGAAPDYQALTRRAMDQIRQLLLDLDTQRRDIRRLGGETREILARLAA
jgi:hypothetical protein